MKEGLVLPRGIVILREVRNDQDKITGLVPWSLSEIPDSEVEKINTSITHILEHPDYPNTCGLYRTDRNSSGTSTSYRIARSGSWATTNVR